jgi:hypothetical protein
LPRILFFAENLFQKPFSFVEQKLCISFLLLPYSACLHSIISCAAHSLNHYKRSEKRRENNFFMFANKVVYFMTLCAFVRVIKKVCFSILPSAFLTCFPFWGSVYMLTRIVPNFIAVCQFRSILVNINICVCVRKYSEWETILWFQKTWLRIEVNLHLLYKNQNFNFLPNYSIDKRPQKPPKKC